MKYHFLEMLMQIFEQSMLKMRLAPTKHVFSEDESEPENEATEQTQHLSPLRHPINQSSIRIFTEQEYKRFTKPSYQFLLRMHKLGIIDDAQREEVMNQLLFSDSRYITLEEMKWVIRHVVAPSLDDKTIAFLDMVLYQQEDDIPKH